MWSRILPTAVRSSEYRDAIKRKINAYHLFIHAGVVAQGLLQYLSATFTAQVWSSMTGWRAGWLQAPKALGPAIERIIQVNSSGTPAFLQRGCVAALDNGDEFLDSQVAKARANRDLVVERLREMPGIRFEVPQGAFYLFFGIDGMTDSAATTKRIIDEAKVGFAPGSTFGLGGEGHLRMCYLRDPAKIEEALIRFGAWLKNHRPI